MIPKELIKKIRKIEIVTNRMVNEQLAGRYHSVFKGQGMDFDEVRQYQPGDDVRLIDWNVSARQGDLFIKRYVEERELTVILLVDASASGTFGTRKRFKNELIAELSALLAFSAIKNNDRVGLIIFTDRVEKFIPAKKGKKHVLRVIMEILNFRPKGRGTDLSVGLTYLDRISNRKSVAFLLSDFLTEGFEKAIGIMSRKHDLIPIVVSDPAEEELPNIGLAHLEDPETGELYLIDTSSPRVRRKFAEQAQRERFIRESLFRRLRLDFINIRTDRPYLMALVNYFRIRAQRY
ncbi:MAG: DUF58 domain-containing protein [Myxococcales bacterium]|nr:DUF58 domain-containing protein [Myxococcales bacterium]